MEYQKRVTVHCILLCELCVNIYRQFKNMTDLAAKGGFKMKACTLYYNKGEKSDKNLKT